MAAALLGVSKRTVWRRVSDGQLGQVLNGAPGECTRVGLVQVLAMAEVTLDESERALVVAADRGAATAQCEFGLWLRGRGQLNEAFRWFQAAARQGEADAMQWLGRALLTGEGVRADRAEGMRWLRRAEQAGHVSAPALLAFLNSEAATGLQGQPLAGRLATIDRDAVLAALGR